MAAGPGREGCGASRFTTFVALQSLRRGTWQQLQYKGDWIRRPLSSSEIGWLVRLLLLMSHLLNHSLHLDQPPPEDGALEPAGFLEVLSVLFLLLHTG